MEFPFKEFDGMNTELSTFEERQQMYDMLNLLDMVPLYCSFNRDALKHGALICYNDGRHGMSFWSWHFDSNPVETHIPFEEFKQRLLDYENSLTNK